jgi:hypothetical protein
MRLIFDVIFSILPSSLFPSQLVGDGKTIAHAAVFAHQDQVMGYSPSMYAAGLAADPNIDYVGEVNNLNAALNNPSLAQASGIKAGGIKYMFIRSHVQDGSNDPFLSGNKVCSCVSVQFLISIRSNVDFDAASRVAAASLFARPRPSS